MWNTFKSTLWSSDRFIRGELLNHPHVLLWGRSWLVGLHTTCGRLVRVRRWLGPAKTHGKPEGNRGDFQGTILLVYFLCFYLSKSGLNSRWRSFLYTDLGSDLRLCWGRCQSKNGLISYFLISFFFLNFHYQTFGAEKHLISLFMEIWR